MGVLLKESHCDLIQKSIYLLITRRYRNRVVAVGMCVLASNWQISVSTEHQVVYTLWKLVAPKASRTLGEYAIPLLKIFKGADFPNHIFIILLGKLLPDCM